MRKIYIPLAIIGLIGFLLLIFQNALEGLVPLLKSPKNSIVDLIPGTGETKTPLPSTSSSPQPVGDSVLTLPQGFSISIFAKNLPGVRDIIEDSYGNFWFSQTEPGVVSFLEVDHEHGVLKRAEEVFTSLRNPHGLAFHPENRDILYIAEEHKVSRVTVYSEAVWEKLFDLPGGGQHVTRTLLFVPEKEKLLISVGSSCNVCHEKDSRRGTILQSSYDGMDVREFAKGLRNSVFMALHPKAGTIWATEMGRDWLGDNTPPDELNIIKEGKNYGWPICYGKNIHDTAFDKNTYIRNPCMEPFETESLIDIPAHSAPLGLAFFPYEGTWPDEYKGDLLVAYHGSWNRSDPTGYKIVRYDLNENSELIGTYDFATGWLTKDGVLGRPVDILIEPDQKLYITDDRAGVVYRVDYKRP